MLARFLTKNEFSYCTDCYQRIFTKNCRQCEAPIQSGTKELSLTGETDYHRECFKCVVCQVSLLEVEVEGRYVQLEDGLHCAECAAPSPCWQCGQEITARDLRLRRRDRQWHQACLQCGHCHSPLPGHSFSWREDQPYCLPCINLLFCKSCEGCPQPIRNYFQQCWAVLAHH